MTNSLICPRCNRRCGNRTGFDSHIATCLKHPGDEQLATDWLNLQSIRKIATKYEVSRFIMADWLRKAKIEYRRYNKTAAKAKQERVYPELAPLFQQSRCVKCIGLPFCKMLTPHGWILCEAPDSLQVEHLKEFGIDIRLLIQHKKELDNGNARKDTFSLAADYYNFFVDGV